MLRRDIGEFAFEPSRGLEDFALVEVVFLMAYTRPAAGVFGEALGVGEEDLGAVWSGELEDRFDGVFPAGAFLDDV